MRNYQDLLADIIHEGEEKTDRTGVGTYSLFGRTLEFDMKDGFPLMQCKKLPPRVIFEELMWFLRGQTDVRILQEKKVKIWDSWRKPYSTDRDLVWVERRHPIPSRPYTGDFSTRIVGLSDQDKSLANTWTRMMKRCYDPSEHNYSYYGGAGKTVCERWHDQNIFICDVKKLPHWVYKQAEWNCFELDSDYFGAGQYGPDTSVWLHTAENNKYTKTAKAVKVRSATGEEYVFLTSSDACRELGISSTSLSRRMRQGPPKTAKQGNKLFVGWDFEYIEESDLLLRYELISDGDMGPIYGRQFRNFAGVDQLTEFVDGIIENPNSRRHLITLWNPADVPKMALPPCHGIVIQAYCHNDGGLSLFMHQRSADVFLGVPFNIASYAFFLHMLAFVTDRTPRRLVMSFGDVHIYSNHLDQVGELLDRVVYPPLPKLTIDPYTRFEDANTFRYLGPIEKLLAFQWSDMKIEGYDPLPAIKAPVAV